MAIRFVDVEPDEGAKPVPARRAPEEAPESRPEPVEGPRSAGAEAASGDEVPAPGLPHAKPEPKQRGRRTPMSSAGADRPRTEDAPAASLLDGLLPEHQAHAKPTPKPRGRKKAFG